MNFSLLLQGLIEISLSLVTGLLIFFFSFKLFTLFTRNIDELTQIKNNNVAIGLLLSSFVFGIIYLVKCAIDPASETLTNVMSVKNIKVMILIYAIFRILIIYIIASVFAFITLYLAIKLFMLLTTDIDEMEEIGGSNLAVSLIISTLIVSVSIILSEPLSTILRGLVPAARVTDKEPIINFSNLIQGSVELGISFFAVIFIYFFGFKIFNFLTKKMDEVKELKANNIAVSIILSSFIFSMMLMVKSGIDPANKTLEFAMNKGLMDVFISILIILCFFAASSVIAFIILWISMKAFMMLTTDIDELAEIKKKNIAVAIIVAILFISMALVVSNGLKITLEAFVFSPKFGSEELPVLPIIR
jgi:uncharacterized membrane protein YjfL (UPF0719 family)